MGCCKSKGAAYDVTAEAHGRGPPKTALGDVDAEDVYADCQDRPADQNLGGLLLQLSNYGILGLIKAKGADKNSRISSVATQTDAAMHKVPSFFPKETVLTGTEFDSTKDALGYACRKGLKPDHPNQDSFFMLKIEGDISIHGVFDGHGRNGHDISNFIKDNLPKLLLKHPDIRENPLKALEDSFEDMQQLIVHAHKERLLDAQRSGSTATVIIIDHRKRTFHVSHVGDSRCVLAQKSLKGGAVQAMDITVDHKPDLPEERARIEAAGGKVVHDGFINHRVYAQNGRGPGLNMSRALGDLTGYFDAGISAKPDLNTHPVNRPGNRVESDSKETMDAADINAEKGANSNSKVSFAVGQERREGEQEERQGSKEKDKLAIGKDTGQGSKSTGTSSHSSGLDKSLRRTQSLSSNQSYKLSAKDQFILICSDGVWEFLSSQEAVEIINTFPLIEAMTAADELTKQAWNLWIEKFQGQIVDDITALVINLAGDSRAPSKK